MSRKKKLTRKYEPRNEFRYNYSPQAKAHPHYVFGEKNGKYKSLGITSTPKEEYPYAELEVHPNPNRSEKGYLQYKVHTANKKYYSDILPNWSFSTNDMALVRNRIKKYKKSTNRRKKKKK